MIWSVVRVWLSQQADVLLVALLVPLACYCALVVTQRNLAQQRLEKARTQIVTLQADAERSAREESERRRSTEQVAETANVPIVQQLAADAVADRDHRGAVAARLRQRAAEYATGSGAAASAPACTCAGVDVPPAAQLTEQARSDLVDLAASANATGRALDACRRYVAAVVLPACAPDTLMQGGR